jgi:hypothetical protein
MSVLTVTNPERRASFCDHKKETSDGQVTTLMARKMSTTRDEVSNMWKTIATTVTTVVIAMLAFWLVEAREYPTRDEVSTMISKESPYVKDQSLIIKQLNENELTNKELTAAIYALKVQISELKSALTTK